MTNASHDLETCAQRLARDSCGDWQRALEVFMLACGQFNLEAWTIAAKHTAVEIEEAVKRHCEVFHAECEELAARTGTKYTGRN